VLIKVLFAIHKILCRHEYNIFQTFRRSKQDHKSTLLRHNTSYSCVHSSGCFPAFTGECQTVETSQIFVRFVYVKHYYYFQTFPQNYFLTYLLTYLFIQRITVVLAKLTGYQRAEKFPAFYETLNFITALTSAHQLSL
jgi:hypothetical protein